MARPQGPGLAQTGIQGQHGDVQPAALEGLAGAPEVRGHGLVPGRVLPLPVPPVQIACVKNGGVRRRHQEGDPFIGGGKSLHGDTGERLCLGAARQKEIPPGGTGLGDLSAEADVVSQQEGGGAAAIFQREDGGREVVLMAVAGKDQQGLARRQRGEVPLPPVEQQQHLGQLYQKAAMAQKGDGAHRYFTAVP